MTSIEPPLLIAQRAVRRVVAKLVEAGFAAAPPRMSARRKVIAVVEDDVSVNQAVHRLLEAAGFETRMFESGAALLSDCKAHTADCIVLDIYLPDMSAFELQGHLRRAGLIAPLILITAHDDPLNRNAAQSIGACAYLTKPFSRRALLDAVELALSLPPVPPDVSGVADDGPADSD